MLLFLILRLGDKSSLKYLLVISFWVVNFNIKSYIVKYGYSDYVFYEFIYIIKLFLFFVILLYFVNLMNITNYSFNEVKLVVFGISL